MQNIINGLPIAAVILLLAVGFAFLVKGADFFVEGSSSIAKKLKVPPIIIGLTIVAMGTSLPETAVSVTASLVQNNELAVSNVVGSNIFNLMFVIGVCSILTPIMVQKATVVRDIPLSLGCALFLLVLGVSGLGDKAGMTLGHADGVIFLIVFAGYIFTMVRSAMKARAAGQKVEIEGVVFTMYDARTNLSLQVVENVKENLDKNIYKTIIPRNVRLAEAPSHGLPINYYDARSTGAESYQLLAEEVIHRGDEEWQ